MACPGPLSRGIPEGLGLRLGHLQPEEHAPRCLAHAFCAPVICGQRDFSQRAAGTEARASVQCWEGLQASGWPGQASQRRRHLC